MISFETVNVSAKERTIKENYLVDINLNKKIATIIDPKAMKALIKDVKDNHYKWLQENFPKFLIKLGINPKYYKGMITSDGDKCYSYVDSEERFNIPFNHFVALYLLSKISPYSDEVRQTVNGWVDPFKWIPENYNRFKGYLEEIHDR